jgi:DNA repair protein RadC
MRAESPLARLYRFGPRILSASELLAQVLGGGGPVPAGELALRLLAAAGSLSTLARLQAHALAAAPGLGRVRAARLSAAFELGRRSDLDARSVGRRVRGPDDLNRLLTAELVGLDREHFVALYLDSRHRIAAVQTISVGTLNASLVHPREVFRPAVAMGAAAVIVAHNHPSGCARPSREDIALTERLCRSGELLGIELLDHLVVGDDEIVSMRAHVWPDSGQRGGRI